MDIRKQDFYLLCAALAMHAELATAGASKKAAEALATAAAELDQSIEEHVARNAFDVAIAMQEEACRRGKFL